MGWSVSWYQSKNFYQLVSKLKSWPCVLKNIFQILWICKNDFLQCRGISKIYGEISVKVQELKFRIYWSFWPCLDWNENDKCCHSNMKKTGSLLQETGRVSNIHESKPVKWPALLRILRSSCLVKRMARWKSILWGFQSAQTEQNTTQLWTWAFSAPPSSLHRRKILGR